MEVTNESANQASEVPNEINITDDSEQSPTNVDNDYLSSNIPPTNHDNRTSVVNQIELEDTTQLGALPRIENILHDLPTSGSGENQYVKFQLIPISETPGVSAIGEVVERKLALKETIKIGRQIVRDGQATIKGNKKATEIDIWFTSKVVSRLHAEIWTKDGQLCIKDVGSSSGTFLNKMRLSPSGKESRPYPLKQGDVIQFGVDFKGKTEDVYKAVLLKLGFHDQSWLVAQRQNANPQRFSAALKALIAATNPYGNKAEEINDTSDTECCICLGGIAPFQALFIAPCSHCYHFKCVGSIIAQSPMFQCPLCRQVANLTASVSSESLSESVAVELPMTEAEIQGLLQSLILEKNPPVSAIANKRTSIIDGLLNRHHTASPAITENSTGANNTTDAIARRQSKKRTFSMKLRSFLGGQGQPGQSSTSENASVDGRSIPRNSNALPGIGGIEIVDANSSPSHSAEEAENNVQVE